MLKELKNIKIEYVLLALIIILLLFLLFIYSVPKFEEKNIISKNYPSTNYEIYQESVYPVEAFNTKVYTELIPEGDAARPGTKRVIKYLVIHETDNFSEGVRASNHASYLKNNNNSETSWHYTVDDTEIYHHMPDDEVAYHAGEHKGNEFGIGIELCVNSDGDFEKTFINAAKLCAYLIKSYHLDIDAIKTHHDFNGKDCPHKILASNRLDEFKDLVASYLKVS